MVAARPNFVKIKPILDALEVAGCATQLVHTGQHYDAPMSDVFFDELGIRSPDVEFRVGSGTHAVQTGRTMIAFEEYIHESKPDWVVVVGDVNATLACALVGAKSDSRVAHVEAGLRSWDHAMPEEVNRVITDRVSDLLLAPSSDAVDNLLAEGASANRIELVGNVMVDSLYANLARALDRPVLQQLGLNVGDYVLLTLHRPSNVDSPDVLARLLDAAREVTRHLPVVFPAHPRTAAKLPAHASSDGVLIIEPKGYLDFIALEAGARLVLTDSGGVQEETTALSVPCLTLRDNTERPSTIVNGTNRLVGTRPAAIIDAARDVLANGVEARCPELWDGQAGPRIVQALAAHLEGDRALARQRSTELVL